MTDFYWSCVFSVHPKTTREICKIKLSSTQIHLPSYVNTTDIPTHFPTNSILLDMCRNLLYEINIKEEKWTPDPHTHTRYHLRKSKLINKPMLCDRYDEKSFWVAILTPDLKVVGIERMITSYLLDTPTDLDLLGYKSCPDLIHKWVQDSPINVAEIDRTAIHKEHRRNYLFAYINYHLAEYMLNEKYWGRNTIALCTFPEDKPHLKFMKLINGIYMKEWDFKYDPNDTHFANVFITHAKYMVKGIQIYLNMYNSRAKL